MVMTVLRRRIEPREMPQSRTVMCGRGGGLPSNQRLSHPASDRGRAPTAGLMVELS